MCAGENYAHGARFLMSRQGAEEEVDGMRQGVSATLLQQQFASGEASARIGRDNVDMVRLREVPCTISSTGKSIAAEDLRELTLVVGREMRNDYERHPGVRRQTPEQFDVGFDPASRRTNPDHHIR